MALGCLSLLELQGFLSKIPKTWAMSHSEEWGGLTGGGCWYLFLASLHHGSWERNIHFFSFFYPNVWLLESIFTETIWAIGSK